VLESAEEAISHNRRFVLKPDTKLTHYFVCDLRFFRTFGAASKPLCSANPLSIREQRPSILELLSRKNRIG
jgi:hypothetical protein